MSNPKRLRLLASLPVRFQDMRDDQLNFELELRGFSESDFKQLSRLEREQWLRTLRESEREDMKEKQRIKSAQEGVTQQSQHGVFYSGLCRLGTEMLFTLCDFLDSSQVPALAQTCWFMRARLSFRLDVNVNVNKSNHDIASLYLQRRTQWHLTYNANTHRPTTWYSQLPCPQFFLSLSKLKRLKLIVTSSYSLQTLLFTLQRCHLLAELDIQSAQMETEHEDERPYDWSVHPFDFGNLRVFRYRTSSDTPATLLRLLNGAPRLQCLSLPEQCARDEELLTLLHSIPAMCGVPPALQLVDFISTNKKPCTVSFLSSSSSLTATSRLLAPRHFKWSRAAALLIKIQHLVICDAPRALNDMQAVSRNAFSNVQSLELLKVHSTSMRSLLNACGLLFPEVVRLHVAVSVSGHDSELTVGTVVRELTRKDKQFAKLEQLQISMRKYQQSAQLRMAFDAAEEEAKRMRPRLKKLNLVEMQPLL